jgi:DNA repair protein RadC
MPQARQTKEMISLKDWPVSERPRERLFRHGVRSLSDAELLALFLRSGIRGRNVRDLALHLLESFQGLSGLAKQSPRELLRVSGLGPAKAAVLIAAFEIGSRLLRKKVESRPLIESAEDLFELLQHSLAGEREEVFMGVLLNAKNEVMKTLTFSRGDPTQVVATVPQVIRSLLLEGSPAVIFVHNHPSGDPAPSEEDKKLTARLHKACRAVDIGMHDHIILGRRNFFSFAREGLI